MRVPQSALSTLPTLRRTGDLTCVVDDLRVWVGPACVWDCGAFFGFAGQFFVKNSYFRLKNSKIEILQYMNKSIKNSNLDLKCSPKNP